MLIYIALCYAVSNTLRIIMRVYMTASDLQLFSVRIQQQHAVEIALAKSSIRV